MPGRPASSLHPPCPAPSACPSAPATLQLDVQGGEGFHADEVVHHTCCVGIVGAIVEFVNGARWVLEALVPRATVGGSQQKPSSCPSQPPSPASLRHSLLSHKLGMLGIHHTDGLGQVPEDDGVAEVQRWGHIVL